MQFDQENRVIKLCVEGMTREGEGKNEEASRLFYKAWDTAITDSEKFTAAHYVARQQKNTNDKLYWDKRALDFALKIADESIKKVYPSLYLNIAKGYEDLNNLQKAKETYDLALHYLDHLTEDAYGNMIRGGIKRGLERIQNTT